MTKVGPNEKNSKHRKSVKRSQTKSTSGSSYPWICSNLTRTSLNSLITTLSRYRVKTKLPWTNQPRGSMLDEKKTGNRSPVSCNSNNREYRTCLMFHRFFIVLAKNAIFNSPSIFLSNCKKNFNCKNSFFHGWWRLLRLSWTFFCYRLFKLA